MMRRMAGASLLALVTATPAAAVEDYRIWVTIENEDRSQEWEFAIDCVGAATCDAEPIEVHDGTQERAISAWTRIEVAGLISLYVKAGGFKSLESPTDGRASADIPHRSGEIAEFTISQYGPPPEGGGRWPIIPVLHIRAAVE